MSSEERKRYLSIDVFRGLTIAVMVFVNFVGEFPNTPSWSKHAPDIGLTYVDLVAPFFIFAISLTYKKSYDHYKKKLGGLENFLRHFRRYVTLIGMGMFTELTLTSTGFYFRWAALQAIGFAGLFTYLFIRFSKRVRLIIACIISILYTALLETTIIVDGTPIKISDLNLLDVHGGVIGAIGFGLILLFGTIVSESFETKKMSDFIIYGIIFTALGVITNLFWGFSKNRVSISYVFISLGLASLIFYIIWYIYDSRQITHGFSRIFQPIGKNSIFLYVFHGLLVLLGSLIVPEDAPFSIISIVGMLLIAIIWYVAYVLDKKKVYIII